MLRNHQGVHFRLPRLPVEYKPETILKKRLKHRVLLRSVCPEEKSPVMS